MEKREIYLLGIGHGTPIFMELAEACGYTIAGLYHYNDERTGEIDHGYKILGSFEDLFRSDIKGKLFCLTMGDMNTKTLVSKRLMAMGGYSGPYTSNSHRFHLCQYIRLWCPSLQSL